MAKIYSIPPEITQFWEMGSQHRVGGSTCPGKDVLFYFEKNCTSKIKKQLFIWDQYYLLAVMAPH